MKNFINKFLKSKEIVFCPGEFIFHLGDKALYVFYVIRGKVRLERSTIEGSTVTMAIAKTGNTFAEGAFSSDIYHCDAISESKSIVLCLPKHDLIEAITRNPELAKKFVATLSMQLIDQRALLEIRNIRSAKKRIIQYFLFLADPATLSLEIESHFKDIAHDIGLAHETVYRTLAELERDGTIKRNGYKIYFCLKKH